MTPTTPHPIFAELREKAVAKKRAHDRKIFNDACNQIAAYMDGLELAELFSTERTKEITQAWTRVWDALNPDRTSGTVEFKVKRITYWLTRDI
jgi:hypothetical protein